MKTLKDKVIIYDDVCPLCNAYTEGFVQLGWLMPENRIGFAAANPELLKKIDINRARHEIPLFDKITEETLYGKEALFYIIGEQFPILIPLFAFSFFKIFIYFLYQIITYNRRIIAGSKAPKTGFDCAPDFNIKYRIIYILLAGLFCYLLNPLNTQTIDFQFLITIFVFGAAILRGLFYRGILKKMDYWGHLITVILILHIIAPFVNGLLTTNVLGIFLMWKRLK
jgi:predicted DCC family thiol-disulfide oxidoreductase YuxK